MNLDGSASLARQIEAQENMDDWGRYAVPGLMYCLTKCTSEEAKAKASQRLAVNAQEQLLTEYTKRDLAPEEELRQKEANKKIRAANRELKAWFYNAMKSEDSTPEALKAHQERIAAVEGFWATWWQENESQWSYSMGQKVGIFFFDTRFAKYWGNLLRLDFGKSHIDKKPVVDTVLSKLKY